MKLLRPTLLTVGTLVFLGVIAVGLALVPSMQHWAVMRAAAKQPGLNLKLASISAGVSSLTLRGVQLEHRGVKVTLDQLTVEYSLWAFLSGRRLQIGQLTAQGLLVDASKLSPRQAQAGLAAAPAVAPGALAQVKLPWALTLDGIDLKGRVLLAGASGQPALLSEFTLTGGQIAPGREGELKLKAKVTDPAPGASVTALDAVATVQLRESLRQTFDHIHLTLLLDATGPGLAGQNELKLVAEMTRATAGENYHVTLDTLQAGQSENVLTLNAALAPGAASYAGDWTLAARTVQLESFLLGRALPKFAATGSGRFIFSPASTGAALQGGLQIEAAEFEKLQPELRALGPVRLKSDFEITAEAGLIRFNKLAIGLAGEQPVLDLRTTGSPVFNLKQRRFEPGPVAGEIIRMKITELPLAWLAPFCPAAEISGGPISGEISVVQGEGAQLSLQTNTPLQTEGVTVVRAGRTLLAKAGLTIDAEANYSPTRAHASIRALTLKTAAGDAVQAKLSVTAPDGLRFPLEVAADFTADLPAMLVPLLPAAGPLKARGSLGFNWQGERLEVLRLALESTDAKGQLLGSATLTRAFTYDLAHGRAETGAPNEVTLGNLKLGQLPLITVAKVFGDYAVSGRPGPAEATLTASGGKLLVRATAPVPILDFSVTQKKKPVLDRLKLQLQPVVEFGHGAVTQVQSGKISLLTGADVSLAELNAELTQSDSGILAVSTFSLDLPAWATQPAWLGRDALASGQASGELRAAFTGGGTQVEARATLNGMVASEGRQTLPVANLSLRADVDATGRFSVQAPVLLDRAGQRSDFRLSGDGVMAATGLSFEAKLTSEHIELHDLLMLLAVAGSPLAGEGEESPAAQSRALSPPAADQAPFWTDTTGQFTLDCKSVVSGQDWAMSGLTGRLLLGAEQLRLEKLEASFDEKSRFAAKGALAFTAGLDPYHLTGDFSLTEFDTARFFKALDPERTPTLEGLFTVKGQLEGQGLNFDDTIDRTRGSFDLTSRKGVFRGLKRSTDKVSMATKAVDLFSAIIGDKSAEKIIGVAYYIDQLAQELGELKYDQFTVRLVRDPSLNLKLEDISLVAQQIHLIGSGQVTYVAGQPLLQQPLQASLSLRAREKTEELLGRIKDLDGTRDQLGYAKTKTPVTIGGTPAKPNPGAYFIQLGVGKIGDKLNDFLAPGN